MKKLLILLMIFSLFGCAKNSDSYYVAHESNFMMTECSNGPCNVISYFEFFNENKEIIDLSAYESVNEADLVMVAVASSVDKPIKELKIVLNDLIWEAYVTCLDKTTRYFEFDLKSHTLYDYEKDRLEEVDAGLKEDVYYLNYVIEEGIDFNGLIYNVYRADKSVLSETLYPAENFEYGKEYPMNENHSITTAYDDAAIEFAIIDKFGNNQRVKFINIGKEIVPGQYNTIIFHLRSGGEIYYRVR